MYSSGRAHSDAIKAGIAKANRTSKFASIAGNRYGHWTAKAEYRRNARNEILMKFVCSCGAEAFCRPRDVIDGKSKSCGCKKYKTHGLSNTPEHKVWENMLNRCRNPNMENYKNYGGRGISVCERWKVFENFLEDMGLRPGKSYSIERNNVDGNYEPENCRWATLAEQASNRTNSVRYSFFGISACKSEWCRCCGIQLTTVNKRLKRGLPPEQALDIHDISIAWG